MRGGEVWKRVTEPGRGRRLLVVFGVLVAGAGVVAGAWHWWLPTYRPGLERGERYGVDVSNHQGDIDWARVAEDDVDFAYIKATEGGDFVDERFERNWEGAGDAGLDRGAYHFFTLCRPGIEQAELFLRTVPPDPDALPPVVDLELAGNCSARPDRATVARELEAFLTRVEADAGEPVVLYLGDDFEGHYRVRDRLDRELWLRRIVRRPGLDGWWIWQFHHSASVDGIRGSADLNVMRGDHPSDVPG
jgi:lysozyme